MNHIQNEHHAAGGAEGNQNARDKTIIIQAPVSFDAEYTGDLHARW